MQMFSISDSLKRQMKKTHHSSSRSKAYQKNGEAFIFEDISKYTSVDESDNVFLPPNDNGNNKENDEYQKEFVDYVNSFLHL